VVDSKSLFLLKSRQSKILIKLPCSKLVRLLRSLSKTKHGVLISLLTGHVLNWMNIFIGWAWPRTNYVLLEALKRCQNIRTQILGKLILSVRIWGEACISFLQYVENISRFWYSFLIISDLWVSHYSHMVARVEKLFATSPTSNPSIQDSWFFSKFLKLFIFQMLLISLEYYWNFWKIPTTPDFFRKFQTSWNISNNS
jgi:hypothetical protein